MSKVTVENKTGIKRLVQDNEDTSYLIAPLYDSGTDPNYKYTYLKFTMVDACNEDEAIVKYKTARRISHDFECIVGHVVTVIDKSHDSMMGEMVVQYNIDAEETTTEGKDEYIVCLKCGGEMGNPEFTYSHFQIIRANSVYEAVSKYNEINKCVYFYGTYFGAVIRRGE